MLFKLIDGSMGQIFIRFVFQSAIIKRKASGCDVDYAEVWF